MEPIKRYMVVMTDPEPIALWEHREPEIKNEVCLSSDVARLEEEIDELKHEVSAKETALGIDKTALVNELAKMQGEKNDLEAENAKMDAGLATYETRIVHDGRTIEFLQAENARLTADLTSMEGLVMGYDSILALLCSDSECFRCERIRTIVRRVLAEGEGK